MTDDMRSGNDVIQGIAESFWEVTEGSAKECRDLAEIAYNAACTAGMVTPDEVMATARYLSASLDRIEELENDLAGVVPRETYVWLRDRYLRLSDAAKNILDHEPYGDEWEGLRQEHIDNLRKALALGKRPADDKNAAG